MIKCLLFLILTTNIGMKAFSQPGDHLTNRFRTSVITKMEYDGKEFKDTELLSYPTTFQITDKYFYIESDHPDIGSKNIKLAGAPVETPNKEIITYVGGVVGDSATFYVSVYYNKKSSVYAKKREIIKVQLFAGNIGYRFHSYSPIDYF